MSTAILQLTLLQLKPDSKLDEVGSPAGDALLDVISVVTKAGDGQNRAYFGHQLENPGVGVLAFVYPTEEASRVFSPPSAPKLGAFSTSAATRTFEFSPAEGLDKALEAPTTEIATGYGAEEGYEKNMREFSEVLNGELKGKEDAGFHGCVVGTTVQDISREEGGEKAKAVALVVGWDSREKHMEGREVGEIPSKIGLIRVQRKEMDMWHVNFKEY
ncbi:hypothetical protein NKR19_g943 [Coniochaeta hoffmannii]|uniref:ABM domain-containing protein n=1 Tax=Coniochaeta hoffmannii TaxID=91930 RepID=A0AA38W0G0_9PEZI|nr:hypothetical protein NKR19_g943 [Coniochaeta hoffmannii]